VKDEALEVVLLKHYRNIQQLSRKQLDALQKENTAEIHELIAQKQIIIDQVEKTREKVEITAIPAAAAKKLMQLLTDISLLEEESRKLVSGRQDAVRQQLFANQQAKIIRQAYEAPLSTGRVVNRTK
jgi:hypothetical protein